MTNPSENFDNELYSPREAARQIAAEVDGLIPDRCLGCATLCELRDRLGQILVQKALEVQIAQELIGDADNLTCIVPGDESPRRATEEEKGIARMSVADDLDRLDREIEAQKDHIKGITENCGGVLKMRASKGGISYTVNVCTSGTLYQSGAETHLPTHITAQPTSRNKYGD